MIVTVNEANEYIKKNRRKVIDKYRHTYHVMAPIGWINDPNGFCEFKDEYHLFYQYYPYDSKWGPMHWGHVKSKDFIKWEELPVALAPDKDYDCGGVFSGSGIQVGNEIYLMYTGHKHLDKDNEEDIRQVQCLAKSIDGIHFKKLENNPVINSGQIPEDGRIQDFRDPKVWKKDGKYYAVIGSKTKDYKGQVGFYVSEDLINWKYLNRFKIEEDFGSVWECPDLFQLDNKHILLISPQHMPEDGYQHQNLHGTIAIFGEFDENTGYYEMEHYESLDAGFDFYAPQTLKIKDGRRVMIAWMNMWEREQPTHTLGHYWTGAMTLPRELSIKNNKLYQKPVREIKKYQRNEEVMEQIIVNGEVSIENIKLKSHELYIELEDIKDKVLTINLFKNGKESLKLIIDGEKEEIILDRSTIGYPIISINKQEDFIRRQPINFMEKGVKLNIFIDVSSVEIFINNGEYVMTSLVYPKKEGHISFYSKDNVRIKKFKKWDLEVLV